MSKNLEKTYNPKEIEAKLYEKWCEEKYFHAEVDRSKKPFTTVMPPPNITGKLHMGHALDNTLQDILIRYKRMQGYNALWIPGTDHAAISTEVKVTNQLKAEGKKVVLAAADTFRAAAIDQLAEWANRAGVELIAQKEGSDPAAVIYDAISAAKSRNADVLICDTAGRLHNKKNLMEELHKIYRILEKEYPEAYLETLVVLDGTTGQNALQQARQFAEVANVTGIILTKLDGTAKGGIAVAIQSELDIPVKYIGVGESIHDLQKFDADQFVNALFHTSEENA